MTRHDLDLFSLLSGLVLTAIALWGLFDVGLDLGPWVWPAGLIAVGVIILARVLGSGRWSGRDEPAQAPEQADDTEGTEGTAAARADLGAAGDTAD